MILVKNSKFLLSLLCFENALICIIMLYIKEEGFLGYKNVIFT